MSLRLISRSPLDTFIYYRRLTVTSVAAVPVGRLPTGAGKLPALPIFKTRSQLFQPFRFLRQWSVVSGPWSFDVRCSMFDVEW